MDELKIKYYLKFYFSQTLIFTGFFDFIHQLNVYKSNECMLLAFYFIGIWGQKK